MESSSLPPRDRSPLASGGLGGRFEAGARALSVAMAAFWAGGLIVLFLLVTRLFAVDRSTAFLVAGEVFMAFERYQLVLAAAGLGVSLVAAGLGRGGARWLIPLAFAMAGALAVVNWAVLTPEIERLRVAGEAGTERFGRLHGYSMILYVINTAILALVVLGAIVRAMLARPAAR